MAKNHALMRQEMTRLSRDQLVATQLSRLNELLIAITPLNGFYGKLLGTNGVQINSLQELQNLPTVRKEDLVESIDQEGRSFQTFPAEQYLRFHRTSGTSGRPLPISDTRSDWQWWIDTWQYVLDAAEVSSTDTAFMAFSFGPFIGFWSANDALLARDVKVIPGGGLSTLARLDLLMETQATILCATPTYALHLQEVASRSKIDLTKSNVRCIIVAGEPGGSVPEVRSRIESAWGASVMDHSGASEVGPWGFGTPDGTSLYVIESEFIAEFLLEDGTAASEGELSELVLTNLGRYGAPAIRYRTGDLVRPNWSHKDECRFVRLEGGVLGRADDMVVIRGVNVFPSSIDNVIRSFDELGEYRIILSKRGAMDELSLQVEDPENKPDRIAAAFESKIGLRVEIEVVPMDSLKRFEAKAHRVIDQR